MSRASATVRRQVTTAGHWAKCAIVNPFSSGVKTGVTVTNSLAASGYASVDALESSNNRARLSARRKCHRLRVVIGAEDNELNPARDAVRLLDDLLAEGRLHLVARDAR